MLTNILTYVSYLNQMVPCSSCNYHIIYKAKKAADRFLENANKLRIIPLLTNANVTQKVFLEKSFLRSLVPKALLGPLA